MVWCGTMASRRLGPRTPMRTAPRHRHIQLVVPSIQTVEPMGSTGRTWRLRHATQPMCAAHWQHPVEWQPCQLASQADMPTGELCIQPGSQTLAGSGSRQASAAAGTGLHHQLILGDAARRAHLMAAPLALGVGTMPLQTCSPLTGGLHALTLRDRGKTGVLSSRRRQRW